jgi:triacylglycerol lipase
VELELTPGVSLRYSNAQYLAMASLFVYGKDSVQFRNELNVEGELFKLGNIQAFVGASETNIIVAFRGTESPLTADGRKDWLLTNARQNLTLPPEGEFGADFAATGVTARFHQGFLVALADVWDKFFPRLEELWKAQQRPVWLTGHSLGGALAALAAWRIERRGVDVHRLYTFAAPMFCDVAGAEGYNQRFLNRTYRFVNQADLIPAMPISNLLNNEYRHVGVAEVLPADTSSPSSPARELIANMLSFLGTLTGPVSQASLTGLLWKEVESRTAAHSLSKGYISRIIDWRKSHGEL